MRIERTKNAGRNIAWGLCNQIVVLGLPFALRTIILAVLGTEYLGLSSLFTSVIQVLNLSELGFATAVVFSLYKPIAEDDKETISAIMAYYRRIYKIIGWVVLFAGLCVLPWINYLISGNVPDGINVKLIYFIFLVNTSISYFLFSYKECLILAHQRNDLASKINIIVKLAMYSLQILLLILFKDYYLYAVMMPVSTALNNILISIVVNKYYPMYKCKGVLSEDIRREIKTQVSGLMITKIAATTRNSFDNIIISAFIGLSLVGIYGNYYYIMTSVQAVMLIIANSMQAGIGNSVAIESVEKNFTDFRKFTFGYAWIAGFATVCMIFLYQPFMRLWVGEARLLPFNVVILICIYFYLLVAGDISNLYINATGIWCYYKVKSIVEALSNLLLNILLVNWLGIFGVVLATVITRLLFGILWGNIILYKRYFGMQKIRKFFLDFIQYMVSMCLVCLLIYLLECWIKIDINQMYIINFLYCMVVPNVVYYIFFRKSKRYKGIVGMVKQFIRFKKNKKLV